MRRPAQVNSFLVVTSLDQCCSQDSNPETPDPNARLLAFMETQRQVELVPAGPEDFISHALVRLRWDISSPLPSYSQDKAGARRHRAGSGASGHCPMLALCAYSPPDCPCGLRDLPGQGRHLLRSGPSQGQFLYFKAGCLHLFWPQFPPLQNGNSLIQTGRWKAGIPLAFSAKAPCPSVRTESSRS